MSSSGPMLYYHERAVGPEVKHDGTSGEDSTICIDKERGTVTEDERAALRPPARDAVRRTSFSWRKTTKDGEVASFEFSTLFEKDRFERNYPEKNWFVDAEQEARGFNYHMLQNRSLDWLFTNKVGERLEPGTVLVERDMYDSAVKLNSAGVKVKVDRWDMTKGDRGPDAGGAPIMLVDRSSMRPKAYSFLAEEWTYRFREHKLQ